jgi:hypothetical protein
MLPTYILSWIGCQFKQPSDAMGQIQGKLWSIPKTGLCPKSVVRWNCCFCSPVAEIRAGRFQTPESYNPISRWQFCHHDVFNLSQRISQFLEDLEPRWAAGCYICSKENSAAVKCIKKRLLDGTINHVAWQMLEVLGRRVAHRVGKWIYVNSSWNICKNRWT